MEAFEWLCSVQYQKFVFNRPTTAKLHPRQRILDGLDFKYILFLRNLKFAMFKIIRTQPAGADDDDGRTM